MLGKLRHIVGEEVSLCLYKTLITPLLDYGDIVYDCLSAKDSFELQKIQNCALRIVLQKDRKTHVADMHREANLIYLSDRGHQHTMVQTYKCIHGLAPQRVSQQLEVVTNGHAMSTRSKCNLELAIPRCRLETTKKSFRYRAPALWSLVDDELKSKPSVASFKYNLCNSDMFDIVG